MSDHGWLPEDEAARWCGLDEAASADKRAVVASCRDAAAAYIERVRPDLFGADVADAAGPRVGDDAYLAGLIATKRLYGRQDNGSFGVFGPAAALLELDPDVSALLSLGPHAAPRVG